MANPVLSAPHFHNEEAAFAYVEEQLWPEGPTCPHCGNGDAEPDWPPDGQIQPSRPAQMLRLPEAFTVRIGTIFEDSHFPLRLWLQAIQLCARPRRLSTRQLQRTFNCSMKTAWHLGHRIRVMMAPAAIAGPMGGAGETVEADEMEMGKSPKTEASGWPQGRTSRCLSLVERGGKIRSIVLDHRGIGPRCASISTSAAAW